MSQLHQGSQGFFRQFQADSELPLENRVFSIEYEQARRQRGNESATAQKARNGDFQSPMHFNISQNNELYFLRSCHLRLPINVQFGDEFGNRIRSPEEVSCFAIRNRADRAFRKIESNLNGFRSTRNPDNLAWQEYLCTDDEYGLSLPNDGIGVPLNTAQVSIAPQVGRQQVRTIGSAAPTVRARVVRVQAAWNGHREMTSNSPEPVSKIGYGA